jgi:hypothetical protein
MAMLKLQTESGTAVSRDNRNFDIMFPLFETIGTEISFSLCSRHGLCLRYVVCRLSKRGDARMHQMNDTKVPIDVSNEPSRRSATIKGVHR